MTVALNPRRRWPTVKVDRSQPFRFRTVPKPLFLWTGHLTARSNVIPWDLPGGYRPPHRPSRQCGGLYFLAANRTAPSGVGCSPKGRYPILKTTFQLRSLRKSRLTKSRLLRQTTLPIPRALRPDFSETLALTPLTIRYTVEGTKNEPTGVPHVVQPSSDSLHSGLRNDYC